MQVIINSKSDDYKMPIFYISEKIALKLDASDEVKSQNFIM
jgi:hypothetical protein